MSAAASPVAPLSTLKALRRLFVSETTSPALPEATDAVWPWLNTVTSVRPQAPFSISILTPPNTPHSWVLVVADDQPFLTDTAVLAVRRCLLDVEGLWHPVVTVTRTETSAASTLVNVTASRAAPAKGTGKKNEAWILIRTNRLDDEDTAALTAELTTGLGLSVAVVADFQPMVRTMDALAKTLKGATQREEKAFLEWILDRHMVLLGYRHYDYTVGTTGPVVQATAGSGLGVLRVEHSAVAHATPVAELTTSLGLYVAGDERLVLSKTPNISKVHRATSMDYIAVLERDAKGNVTGEHRFLGLYTSSAYTTAVRDVPLVRAKLEAVAAETNWPHNSHNARSLVNILETWPRDELFLTDTPTLARLTRAAVIVRERADVRILLRHSLREQAVTALVYIPLARMNTHIREAIGALLAAQLGTHILEYKVEMGILGSESDMARIFFRLPWHGTPTLDEDALSARITALVRGWDDDVFDALAATHGPATAAQWLHRFGGMGGAAYRAATPPALAAGDISVVQTAPQQLVQVVPDGATLRLRLFKKDTCWPLSFLMPLVDSCGLAALREETFALGPSIVAPGAPTPPALWLHEILCEMPANFTEKGRVALETVLENSLLGHMERDSLNWLAMGAGFGPREIHVWRAWVMYLQQIDRRFDPRSVRHMVRRRPALARALWEIFEATHNTIVSDRTRTKVVKPLEAELDAAMLAMPTAEEERIWRTLRGVVAATVRTNVWQISKPTEALAFKLDCSAIPHIPDPKPWREIVVYHPTVVGVHLRGGPVARGGLRHSDRKHDFRTEILGLMTAQMRKNTIIVPVGAKGGFYVQQPLPADRTTANAIVVECYTRYISALLSITDTYDAKGQILHPRRVARYDDADPYLVVAADKGTAKFSDIANGIATSVSYWDDMATGQPVVGFWLDDAFASGGSKGYDHKAMAITARGAWVSVMHHLAALGALPTAEKPITLAGIGDMAGDVFGNGLLRSPHVQLVAAFNHMHIFLDPTPDPAASFAERKRMFEAGLGWDGYAPDLISDGGGVFLRKAKSIPVSPQMQQRLGLGGGKSTKEMPPEDVVSAILKAPVDVLWNGGIGTYIKASDEPHTAAADKTNDDVRVDATQVRARVIGEGGNLGITPRGRVELGLRDVCLNTDALDNSAGVDTSDHEVNLKILFQQAKLKGALTEDDRVALLRQMTDDVAELVLADNRLQNLVLSLDAAEPDEAHTELHGWQQTLMEKGFVDPVVDCLPTLKALQGRDIPHYTRPELAALLAGTKAWLRRVVEHDPLLLASDAVHPLLQHAFPKVVQDRFGGLITTHPLAPQLAATVLSNLIINRLGLLAVPRLMRDFDASAEDAVRALTVAMHALQAPHLWQQLDDPRYTAPHATTVAVCQRLRSVVGVLAAWTLRHGQPVDAPTWMTRLTSPLAQVYALLPMILRERPDMQKWVDEWQNMGLPAAMATQLSVMSPMAIAPDAIAMAEMLKHPLSEVLTLHLEVGDYLKLPALIKKVRSIAMPDSWTRQAVQAMEQEIFVRQRRLTETLLKHHKPVTSWRGSCGGSCQRYDALVRSILKERTLTVPMLSVVLGRLREMEG